MEADRWTKRSHKIGNAKVKLKIKTLVLKLRGGPPWGGTESLQGGVDDSWKNMERCRIGKINSSFADVIMLTFVSLKFYLDPFLPAACPIIDKD